MNVYQYLTSKFAPEHYHLTEDEQEDFESVSIDTVCGRCCVETIDAGAKFLLLTSNAYGERNAYNIGNMTVDALMVLING